MTAPRDPDPRRRMRGSARGHGRNYMAGGDMSFPGQHSHEHNYDLDVTGFGALFTGRGPGRILAVLGLAVAALCFAGWFSIILGGARGLDDSSSPSDLLGTVLPSGVPVGAVYFLGFGLGGILFAVGTSMAKAGARGANLLGHLTVVLVIAAASVIGLIRVLDGAALAALKPSFSGSATTAPARTPPRVVVSTSKSATRGGLTMTVARVESHGGKGVVRLRLVNRSDESLGVPVSRFRLSDRNGTVYEAKPFGNDWSEEVGPGGDQTGTITLQKPVALGHGPLRAEFTHVYGSGVNSIAVTAIASH